MKKIFAMLLVTSLLLTACGSKEPEQEISPNTGKPYFRVGMTCQLEPFNTQTNLQTDTTVSIGNNTYCDGYDVQIARKLAENMGMEIQVKKMASDAMEDALDKGTVDAIISGLYPANEETMDFTGTYQTSDIVILVRKNDKAAKFKELKEFKDKKLSGLKDSLFDTMISEVKDAKHEKALESYTELVKVLKEKQIDGVVVSDVLAQRIIQSNSDLAIVKFEEGKGFSKKADAKIAVKKGLKDTEYFEKLQAALQKISQEDRDKILKASK